MPFEEVNRMDQKKAFILDYLSDQYFFNSICDKYHISRKTGYKWVKRYRELGEAGLDDRSSRPRVVASTVDDAMVARIVALRRPTPRAILGARKIQAELLREYAPEEVPSSTTIHNVLVRQGLVERRKARRRTYPVNTKNDPQQNNELWTIDYKGHFPMGNGRRCHPLTICDSHSRYLLRIQGHYRETIRNVQTVLRQVLREYGQPTKLLSDNGGCFASIQSPCGFGTLSYWLIDHGIEPIFSDPGCPGQNGRHERMHRDLKKYCCKSPAKDLRGQNRLLNEFVDFYNHRRPHDSLDRRYPSEVYTASLVAYNERVRPPEYDETMSVRRVLKGGAVRWGHDEWIMVSRGLRDNWVGIKQISELVYEVYYRHVCLGFFQLGDQIESGRYYRLVSDRDFPQRSRDREARSRKD